MISTIFRRDSDEDESSWTDMQMDLTIIFVAVCFGTMMSFGALYALRRYKAAQQTSLLPVYTKNSNGLTIDPPPAYSRNSSMTSGSYYDEKHGLNSSGQTTPISPVPEIRITFPDDVDEQGRHQKGRVVIVKINERGSVGLEPVREDKSFFDLDMDQLGGLKEKERKEHL